MNKNANRNSLLGMPAIFTGMLFVAACVSPGVTLSADTTVTATGSGAVAAGRDVNIEKKKIIKEYDVDKARGIEASRFAGQMYRDCQKYADRVHAMQLDKRPGEPSDGDQPFILSPIYQAPDTRRMFSDKVYKELNTQQERLKAVSGEVINMRLMRQAAPARAMLAKSGRTMTLPGMSGPEPTAAGFEAKRKELETLTSTHCAYLKGLM